jgi:hypothetical protein
LCLDSTSFAEIARSPEREGLPAAFCESNLHADARYMIRTRRQQYILNQAALDEQDDLEIDPAEHANRINDPGLSVVRQDLRDPILAWYDPARNPWCRAPTG